MSHRVFAFVLLFSISAFAGPRNGPHANYGSGGRAHATANVRKPVGPPLTQDMKLKFEVPEDLEDKLLEDDREGKAMYYRFQGGEVVKKINTETVQSSLVLYGPGEKFALDLIRGAPKVAPETSRLRKGQSFSGTVDVGSREQKIGDKKVFFNEVQVRFEMNGLKGILWLKKCTEGAPMTFTMGDLKQALGTLVTVEKE